MIKWYQRDYDAPFTSIPPHGRYQHFCVCGKDRIATLLDSFGESVDANERCRRLLDLFLVSVLLDAGAGTQWSYRTSAADGGRVYRRSEGIAVASLEMFRQGLFSGIPEQNPYQVDKEGLRRLTVEKLAEGLQSKPGNEIAGIEGRASLLLNLAEALDEKKEFFGADGRPGNMLDHLLAHPATQAAAAPVVPLPVLWNVLINGLASIWPASRTVIDGVSLGDSWPCSSMPQVGGTTMVPASPTSPTSAGSNGAANGGAAVAHPTEPWEAILPFHKLTQWLTYSLMQPLSSLAGVRFAGTELLTGLPEYRNGGLFIDLGVLTLKPQDLERGLQNFADYCLRTGVKGVEVAPMFEPGDDVVVEWRGVTVGFLDKLVVEVNKALKNELAGHELSLAQVLEAGSWKVSRATSLFSYFTH